MTKYNITRIKHLLAMLKENRYPNYPKFLAEMKRLDPTGACKLSARTLLRDIEFLKAEYKVPIAYDPVRRGYYLLVRDWNVDLPLLENNEMQAALIGARLAENMMPSPVKQEMRGAIDSLLAVNDRGTDDQMTILSLVAAGSRMAIDPEVFRVVFDAWQRHRTIEITYQPVDKPQTIRVIEPHALAFYEGNWYLRIRTRVKDGVAVPKVGNIATFAVHRIKAARFVPGSFTPDSKIIEEVNQRKIFIFDQIENIELELNDEAIRFVGEQFDYEIIRDAPGKHRIRIPAAPAYRIVNFILAEGGSAKLLNHPEIIKTIQERARKVVALHQQKKQ